VLGGVFLLNGLVFEFKSTRAGVQQKNQGVCIWSGVIGGGTCWAAHVEGITEERSSCIIDACVWAFND
jgi:hypothetical protein